MVGSDDDKGLSVTLGKVEYSIEHVFEVGHFAHKIKAVVVVTRPIDLRAFNHQNKTVVAAVEGFDSLEGTDGEHTTPFHGFGRIVGS